MAMSAMLHHEHDALQENPVLPKVSQPTNPEILRPHAGQAQTSELLGRATAKLFSLPANLLIIVAQINTTIKATSNESDHTHHPSLFQRIFIMASPLSSDIPKPFGSTEKLGQNVTRAVSMPIPAFSDIGKAANDVRIH